VSSELQRSAWLPYPIEALFELINRVEDYPQFLPHCVAAKTCHREGDRVIAEMTLSKAGFTRTLRTQNQLTRPTCVTMTLLEGPFECFEGAWQLTALAPEVTKVSLRLTYELSASWLTPLIKPLFASMDQELLKAFCQHAKRTLEKTEKKA
jgi:ribosome-associated toxin RatA of RatAB toxin-antitoxin module